MTDLASFFRNYPNRCTETHHSDPVVYRAPHKNPAVKPSAAFFMPEVQVWMVTRRMETTAESMLKKLFSDNKVARSSWKSRIRRTSRFVISEWPGTVLPGGVQNKMNQKSAKRSSCGAAGLGISSCTVFFALGPCFFCSGFTEWSSRWERIDLARSTTGLGKPARRATWMP
jgi:hypothetical protein